MKNFFNEKNKTIGIISIIITGIMLLFSFYYLYKKSEVEIALKDSETYKTATYINKLMKDTGIDFKKEPEKKKEKKLTELKVKDLFWQHKIKTKSSSYNSCLDKSLTKEEQKECFYSFFFHKYSQFLDRKWILDKRICDQIEDNFWKDSKLYKRCIFVYAVNAWTKYLNVKECEKIPTDIDMGEYTRERCINNVIYAVFWKDNVIWKYLMTVKERWDWEKSSMYQQLLNKHATYIEGKLQGVDFFEFDIKKYLEDKYKEYQKETKEKNNL